LLQKSFFSSLVNLFQFGKSCPVFFYAFTETVGPQTVDEVFLFVTRVVFFGSLDS
jgi:hypothetical protein